MHNNLLMVVVKDMLLENLISMVQALAALQEMEPGNKLFCIDSKRDRS